ncbi:energy transducer TonB [Bradyrhizobium sp. AUGA SZCCT0222]|uniref:energy transducer TonB family protein n=1 Tax=Bradyrhizobium sp. AUGA SZCCT0222 TaxID=2807668 RepID=UPI001BAD661C|nr:energy transducer TonB [Bradyrhizobium sp. AUGA SZCCT0222]MBR1270796.1 energy transducer TonB [Bradyrhizobium sp. AUGA SZCCT0222]
MAGLFGLLLVSAIPSYAQTDSKTAQMNSVDTWKQQIQTRLASNRAFPPAATGQSGTAKVKFAIDRQGKLISKELAESSGSELLDAAALRMIERSEPFPEPPAEVKDDMLNFTVPVMFFTKKQLPWAGGKWPEEWVEEQKKVDTKIRGICRGC